MFKAWTVSVPVIGDNQFSSVGFAKNTSSSLVSHKEQEYGKLILLGARDIAVGATD